MHRISVALLAAAQLAAEVHTLRLAEAVRRALEQNPEIIIVRLEEQKALHQVTIARDPFIPKVFAGSGLAYTNGIPLSVEGSAPSIVQARAVAFLINRPDSHRVAQARETVKTRELDAAKKRDEIAIRTIELYLNAESMARESKLVNAQVEALERVAATIRALVAEGRRLPVENRRAGLDVARARQRAHTYDLDLAGAEAVLASVLGFPPGDRVRPAAEDRPPPALPDSEEAIVDAAIEDNTDLRKLESTLAAKGFELKAAKSEKLPRLALVGQYALLGRFNNYEDFYRTFQRHNGQIGVSLEIPLYAGRAAGARAAQAQADLRQLRTELDWTRSRVTEDARESYRELKKAETTAEIARLDLELARENVGILLARMNEGRASLEEMETARYLENEKWLTFYGSHHLLELAGYRVLKQTGALAAQFR
jgi:outer membrane protein TolC